MHGEYWSGWMGLSMVIWIGLLLFIVYGLFKIVSRGNKSELSAKQILEQRYARSEISKEEFQQMLNNLRSK